MGKISHFLATVTIVLLASALQSLPANTTPVPQGSSCLCDPADPFDPMAKMPKGPYQGQCINSCQQRSVVLLSSEEAANYGDSHRMWVVANVSHQGKFWVAKIPVDGVADVIYQIEHFPAIVPAAHTELRFRFRKGKEVILLPQASNSTTEPVRLSDLVYSVEAVTVPGEKYDVVAGLFDNFALAYRLVSLADRAEQMIGQKQHRVEQLKLSLTPEQNQRLLQNAIERGNRAGMNRMYNTIEPNCTTEVFYPLDAAINYDPSIDLFQGEVFLNIPTGEQISNLIDNGAIDIAALNQLLAAAVRGSQLEFLQKNIPTISQDALDKRGIETIPLPDLNEELKDSDY